jgi:hypothetical protein
MENCVYVMFFNACMCSELLPSVLVCLTDCEQILQQSTSYVLVCYSVAVEKYMH